VVILTVLFRFQVLSEQLSAAENQVMVCVINHFSGPYRAVGPVCACVRACVSLHVQTTIIEINDL